jgi:hypothetical protein
MSKVQRVISHGRAERGRQEGAVNPNQSVVNTGCASFPSAMCGPPAGRESGHPGRTS